MSKRKIGGQIIQDGNVKSIGELSYNRQDVLGKGAFGTVYRGKFQGTIDVAIKRLLKPLTNDFEKEIFPSIPHHPNIVRFFHVEEDDDFM